MTPKTATRDKGSMEILDHAVEHGLRVEMLPNGTTMIEWHPGRGTISHSHERHLGEFLAAIIVDGGGRWKLTREDG